MKPLSLSDFQRRFQSSILKGTLDESLNVLASSPGDQIAERFAAYAQGYLIRTAESLAEDFPKVEAHVGKDAFAQLAQDFSRSNVSVYRTLGEWSAGFPDYLNTQKIGVLKPWLSDLACLEWTLVLSEMIPDFPLPDMTPFIGLAPEAQLKIRPILHPQLVRLHSAWNINEIFDGAEPSPKETNVVVSPANEMLFSLNAVENQIYDSLLLGYSLGELSEMFVVSEPHVLQEAFMKFMRNKLIWKLDF